MQAPLVDLRADLPERPLPAGGDRALDRLAVAIPIAADESTRRQGLATCPRNTAT